MRGRNELSNYACGVVSTVIELSKLNMGQASVQFCSNAEIRRLNREFRQMDKPTDVLSFPSGQLEWGCEPESPVSMYLSEHGLYLGDIALAVPYAAQQAHESGKPVIDEITLLLVHGTLHLLGWDHDTEERERAMWHRQEALVEGMAHWPKPEIEWPGQK